MILWEIFKALTFCGGIDSVTECVYNIFQEKILYEEGVIMKGLAKERFAVCRNHPEKQEIFKLEKMLIEAGHFYFFNFWADLRPTPFNQNGGDPENDIAWDSYDFLIEIGKPVSMGLSEISVCFNTKGDPKLLELLDMRPAAGKPDATVDDGKLYCDLSAEQAMEIIEKFFKDAK